jgi:hypothetical protein
LLNYYASGALLDDKGARAAQCEAQLQWPRQRELRPVAEVQHLDEHRYTTGPTDLPCDAGCGGYTWTTLSATPNNYNLAQRHGFHSNLPYQYDQIVVLWQDLARTTASIKLEHQPLPWLSHRLSLGGDVTYEGDNEWDPRVDSLASARLPQHQRAKRDQSLARLLRERDLELQAVDASHDVRRRAVLHGEHSLRRRERIGLSDARPQVGDVDREPQPTLEGFSDDKSLGSTCRSRSVGAIACS